MSHSGLKIRRIPIRRRIRPPISLVNRLYLVDIPVTLRVFIVIVKIIKSSKRKQKIYKIR